MSERLQEVEIKIMDLEIVVEQLNEVVVRHEKSIEQLTLQLDIYKQQLESATSVVASQAEETPPPHY